MNLATDKIYDILESKIIAFAGSVASVIGLAIAYWQMRDEAPIHLYQWVAYVLLFVIALGTGFYSVRVRSAKQALCGTFQYFHEINHLYRDVLTQMFKASCAE
jgi:peptidoglycan biosynthesis protein MviN/MurJ (putative lipid II flippase)